MSVSVIIVGYGSEPGLSDCLEAVVASVGVDDQVILVDNGIACVPAVGGVEVVAAPRNLGFAGGAVLGVEHSRGETLVFVNSDAVVAPSAIGSLVDACADPATGLITGCVVLADDPETVNSVGNPVHVTGLSWAGGYGEPVSLHREPGAVTSVSGAFFAIRREVWDLLGGLDPDFFMYYEDADLSLRCWLAGLQVRYCPDAVATHAYEFGRNPQKMFFLERNRLTTILTVFPVPVLLRALPVLAITELALCAVAAREGWLQDRVRAWRWILSHKAALRTRRSRLARSVVAPRALERRLATNLTQSQRQSPPGMALADLGITRYWRCVVSKERAA